MPTLMHLPSLNQGPTWEGLGVWYFFFTETICYRPYFSSFNIVKYIWLNYYRYGNSGFHFTFTFEAVDTHQVLFFT